MRNFPLISVMILFCVSVVWAQVPYKLPPKEVIDIVDAAPTPYVELSPDGNQMLLVEYESMPSIAYMAQPLLRIAGMRITPLMNARQRTTFYTGLVVKNLKNGTSARISLPKDAKLGYPEWSYDGKWLVFTRYLENGVELWIANSESG